MEVCWSIWISRNRVFFKNEKCNVLDVIWNIKVFALNWSSISDITYIKCNFYEIYKVPLYHLA